MASTTGGYVATKLLQNLGAPVNAATVRAVAIWLAFESGTNITGNNPWNIHGTGSCGYRMADTPVAKVAVYCSLDDGIAASSRLLSNSSYYTAVVAALRKGDVLGFFWALVKSPWSGSHYGGDVSKFWGAYTNNYNYSTRTFTLTSVTGTGGTGGTGTTVTANANQLLLDKYVKQYIGTKTWAQVFAIIPDAGEGLTLLTLIEGALAALGINGTSMISQADYDKVRVWAGSNSPGTIDPLGGIGSVLGEIGSGIEFVFLFLAFVLVGFALLLVAALVSGNAAKIKGDAA